MNSGVGEYWHSLVLLIWVCLLQLNCLWKCCSCCLFFYIWLLFHCDHLLPSPSPISNGSINCIEFVLHLLSCMQNISYHLFALLWLLTSGIPPTLWPTQSCSQTLQQCCHQWPFLMIYKTCPAHLICHKCKFRKKYFNSQRSALCTINGVFNCMPTTMPQNVLRDMDMW